MAIWSMLPESLDLNLGAKDGVGNILMRQSSNFPMKPRLNQD